MLHSMFSQAMTALTSMDGDFRELKDSHAQLAASIAFGVPGAKKRK